jgi:hypothetical protein
VQSHDATVTNLGKKGSCLVYESECVWFPFQRPTSAHIQAGSTSESALPL